jgi:fumarylacetoacetate (FAA) hydrolase
MRLGSLRTRARDGQLALVSADLRRALPAGEIAPTMRDALDRWAEVEDALRAADEQFQPDPAAGITLRDGDLLAPLPRASSWIDCGAYPHPMELLAAAQGTEPPDPASASRPPFYDGNGQFTGPGEPLPMLGSSELDLEAELAFVLTGVKQGATASQARSAIAGVTVVNDVTLRDVLRADLQAGKGTYHAKPPASMAPTIVTLDELGDAWDGEQVYARMHTWINGQLLGCPATGVDIAVTIPALIAQAARTRPLGAGTVLGTGTVSNRDPGTGSACMRAAGRSVAGPLHHTIIPAGAGTPGSTAQPASTGQPAVLAESN